MLIFLRVSTNQYADPWAFPRLGCQMENKHIETRLPMFFSRISMEWCKRSQQALRICIYIYTIIYICIHMYDVYILLCELYGYGSSTPIAVQGLNIQVGSWATPTSRRWPAAAWSRSRGIEWSQWSMPPGWKGVGVGVVVVVVAVVGVVFFFFCVVVVVVFP